MSAFRQAFVHDALVVMGERADPGAPGAAITAALCGHWEHEGPCPLAPHHSAAEQDGEVLRLRVLFAARPDDEPEVRRRIGEALAGGETTTGNGATTRWRLVSSRPGVVRPEEQEHGRRLAAS